MKWQSVSYTMGKSSSKLKLKQKYNSQGKHYHRFNVFPPEITKVFQGLMCLSLNFYSAWMTEGTCVFYILSSWADFL